MTQGPITSVANRVTYYTLLQAEITSTERTVSTHENRSFADYDILFFVVKRGNWARATQILPCPLFISGTFNSSLTEVDSVNAQRWYEATYVSNTSVKIRCSSNANNAAIYIYGIKAV